MLGRTGVPTTLFSERVGRDPGRHGCGHDVEPEALRYDTDSRVLRNHLASLLLKKGDFREPCAKGSDARADPDDVQAHLLLAAAYQGLRNVRGPNDITRRSLASTQAARGLPVSRNLYVESRNFAEAIGPSRPWSREPAKSSGALQPGPDLSRDQGAEKARAAFQSAIERNPDFDPAWVGLAGSLEVQGRYDEAVQVYERALANDPRDREFRERLAQLHLRRGDLDAALAATKSFGAPTDEPHGLTRIGQIWREKGLRPGTGDFGEILQKEPGNGEARFAMGLSWRR